MKENIRVSIDIAVLVTDKGMERDVSLHNGNKCWGVGKVLYNHNEPGKAKFFKDIDVVLTDDEIRLIKEEIVKLGW
ncbi:hypothetical protein M0R04_06005 [Candidatus Dojkabacteria bacterium]|nr:hypothetical protein [Candidatus Dojkabacteria bacterium]